MTEYLNTLCTGNWKCFRRNIHSKSSCIYYWVLIKDEFVSNVTSPTRTLVSRLECEAHRSGSSIIKHLVLLRFNHWYSKKRYTSFILFSSDSVVKNATLHPMVIVFDFIVLNTTSKIRDVDDFRLSKSYTITHVTSAILCYQTLSFCYTHEPTNCETYYFNDFSCSNV